MPLCDARYDVIFSGHNGMAISDTGDNRAKVDMAEERLPDDWGDPGPLLAARLVRWQARGVRSIEYGPAIGSRRGMALWVDGWPRRVKAERLHLRWAELEPDPPPHEDPPWVIPP